jgi:hypothetical protein
MATQRVAIDWEGLERALTRRSRESEAFLDTRNGDIVWVTRGWSDDHGFSDDELDEGLAAHRLIPVLPVPPETEHGWMRSFAESLEDGWPRDMLLAASGDLRRTCASRTRQYFPTTACAGSPARRAAGSRAAGVAGGQRYRADERAPCRWLCWTAGPPGCAVMR